MLSASARPWQPPTSTNYTSMPRPAANLPAMYSGAGQNVYNMQVALQGMQVSAPTSYNQVGGFGTQYTAMQPSAPQPRISKTAAKLFVGQLPFECNEQRLRELFGAYGTVEQIHVLRDSDNRSKGAAFITYSTVEEADTAIFTLHNRYRMLTNRAIQVSYAKNSPNISPFGSYNAMEVASLNPSNPLPDVAVATNVPQF